MMKILLISIGTQGDMEPFIAMGELLNGKGCEVTCAFPEQFRYLAEEAGLEFASLGRSFIELLDSDAGRAAMGGGSGWKKFTGVIQLAMKQNPVNKEMVKLQQKVIEELEPDRIIYNGKAVCPILWELENKGKSIFMSPLPYMHYVKGHSHVAFNSNFGSFFNKLSFSLAHFGLVVTVKTSKKWLKLPGKIRSKAIREILKNGKSIYSISPALFPEPGHWNKKIRVLGFRARKQKNNVHLDKDLLDFIVKHSKTLFVSFGSMINSNPAKKTQIILDVLEKHEIPAIINTASGGLVEPGEYNKHLFHFVSNVPYEKIFPKVYGLIHHGGSGTTHLALKHGCANLIIPHIIDQFVWNQIISEKGAGPKGVKINALSFKKFESKVLDLYNNENYKMKAEQMASDMAKDDFEEELFDFICS